MTTEPPAFQVAQHLQSPHLRTCLLVATSTSNKSQIKKAKTHIDGSLRQGHFPIQPLLLAQAPESLVSILFL